MRDRKVSISYWSTGLPGRYTAINRIKLEILTFTRSTFLSTLGAPDTLAAVDVQVGGFNFDTVFKLWAVQHWAWHLQRL